MIAGVRSGKTSFAPLWLHREMVTRGPGDYLACAPSFPLLDKGLRPEIDAFFGRTLGVGSSTDRQFTLSEDGHRRLWPGEPIERPRRIIYGHAANPESLAAMRVKAAVLDEAGQKGFRLDSYEEVRRRLSMDRGRELIVTTAYSLGWLKQKIHDEWEAAKGEHPEIDVINFRSIDNPAFPPEEYDRAFRDLPLWKATMFFDGKFTRPAGLIYGNFDPRNHVVPRHRLPDEWPRYGGLDFGAINTAAVLFAEQLSPSTRLPAGKLIAYREYHPGKLPPETHADNLLSGEPSVPLFVGGSRSEDEWRDKFRAAGLAVIEPPVSGVEPQIDSLFSLIANGRLLVMEDMAGLLDELATYSRVLDDRGEPTERIDNDQFYHLLSAARYFAAWFVRRGGQGGTLSGGSSEVERAPAGVFDAPEAPAASGGGYDDEGGGISFVDW